jgi:hypothetical protein
MAEDPTYYKTQEQGGAETFHCMVCESQGQEHHTHDPELFAQHMAQRHDGRMMATPGERKPEHPHGAPPGQPSDFVPPGQGGTPPGQEGKPEEPGDPEHPAQLPTEPVPEEGV